MTIKTKPMRASSGLRFSRFGWRGSHRAHNYGGNTRKRSATRHGGGEKGHLFFFFFFIIFKYSKEGPISQS